MRGSLLFVERDSVATGHAFSNPLTRGPPKESSGSSSGAIDDTARPRPTGGGLDDDVWAKDGIVVAAPRMRNVSKYVNGHGWSVSLLLRP